MPSREWGASLSGGWFFTEALPEHPEQEEGVADQVSPPQAAGLDEEARQPLEAVVRQEARAAAQPAGDVVEDGPAREGDAGVYGIPVLHQPAFLQGHPQA